MCERVAHVLMLHVVHFHVHIHVRTFMSMCCTCSCCTCACSCGVHCSLHKCVDMYTYSMLMNHDVHVSLIRTCAGHVYTYVHDTYMC